MPSQRTKPPTSRTFPAFVSPYLHHTLDPADKPKSTEIVNHIAREMELHIGYCKTFGISEEEIQATRELQGTSPLHLASSTRIFANRPACTAYTRYVLDIGQSQDWLALQIALAPCLLGYGAVAQMLMTHPGTVKSQENTYWPWIENYAAADYVEAVRLGSGKIDLYTVC